MARYKHLSLSKIAIDLVMYMEQVVRNFSRYHKNMVGSDPRQLSREPVRMTHERFSCTRGVAGLDVR